MRMDPFNTSNKISVRAITNWLTGRVFETTASRSLLMFKIFRKEKPANLQWLQYPSHIDDSLNRVRPKKTCGQSLKYLREYLRVKLIGLNKTVKGKVHPRTGHEGPEEEQWYSSTLSLTSVRNGSGQCHAPAALPRERDPVSMVQGAGWAPAPFWTNKENPAPTGIRFPDRPTRSESLYESNSKITNVRYFWRGVIEIKVCYHSRINSVPDGKRDLLSIFPRMARETLLGQAVPIIEASWSYSDTPHSVGLLWTSVQPNAETSTWQHTTLNKRHPRHRRDSNPQSQRTHALNRATTICLPIPRLLLICGRKSCVRYWRYVCLMRGRKV